MFFDQDIKGNRLPPGVLCLTYDDGPGESRGEAGPHTLELGRYLFEQGIGATFFAVGRHAEEHPAILGRLKEWGHLVGNHTYNHPGLVAVATSGGDVAGELARADAVIRPAVSGDTVFFRPPYGNWRERQESGEDRPTSVVAEILNRGPRFADYVGPVNWDISAADYDFWKRGTSAKECARAYLEKIDAVGRGIVLMHDSSEDEVVSARNRALQATKLLVPALRERGYDFVRLDAIPQVRSATRVSSQVRLRTTRGRFLCRSGRGDALGFVGRAADAGEVFGVVKLGEHRVALRASNGLYLSAGREGEAVLAGAPEIGVWECLRVEKVARTKVVLRTARGDYLTRGGDPGGTLLSGGSRRDRSAVFQVEERFARR